MQSTSGLAQRLRGRALLADGALALALIAICVPSLWLSPNTGPPSPAPDAWAVLLAAAGCVGVVGRRIAPVVALLSCLLPAVLLATRGFVFGVTWLAILVALYSVAAYCRRGTSLACLVTTVLAGALSSALDTYPHRPVDYLALLGVFGASWAFGRSLRVRRAYVSELESRAAASQATRDADARAVIAEERGRIARELHDVVAHHVSVMTVQAAAAQRTLWRNPEQSFDAMVAVERTGREALAEMRRIVGVLRRDEDVHPCERAPQPGVAQLEALLDQLREAGLPVDLHVIGTPRPLDAGVDLTVYRIVQEALTNTLKHAGPSSSARVTVAFAPESVHVGIVDDGRGAAAALEAPAGRPGHGLLGMQERIGLYGGELAAGPRPGGGFEVRAEVPLDEVPA